MKKIVFLVLSLLVLCGCSTTNEIDRGFLATTVGFYESDGQITVVIDALSSSNDNPAQQLLLSGSGNSPQAALDNLKTHLAKPLYFKQLGCAVFDTSLRPENLTTCIDLLLSMQDVHFGIYAVKTDDIKTLFKLTPQSESLGYDIIGLVKNFENQTGAKTKSQLYQSGDCSAFLPTINVVDGNLVIKNLGDSL